jgi:hypothetical protein
VKDNVGRVFVDYRHLIDSGDFVAYAVGTTGFIDLSTGSFVQYDSAFNGPEYFNDPTFLQCYVTLD